MSDTRKKDKETITELDAPSSLLHDGPEWLKSRRGESVATYERMAMPLRTSHLWRYTDPAQFTVERVTPVVADSDITPEALRLALADLKENRVAAVATDRAGYTIEVAPSDYIDRKKLVLCSLSAALSTHGPIVEKHLGSLVGKEFGKFEALNEAVWHDGILLYVPEGVKIDEPVMLIHQGAPTDVWSFGRLLIVVAEGASVTIVDEYISSSETVTQRANNVVEIIGGPDSETQYVALHRANTNATTYFTQRSSLADKARSTLLMASLGGAQTKADIGVQLEGRHAESRQYGLVFGSGKQKFDHHTVHIHSGANGYSNLDFKVVLKDRAQSAYTGLIRVEADTPYCEAYQSNRNLLLTSGARAESIPELEILCDEVICTHGATVGPIDPMEVFYLMSRGVSYREAIKMIVRGHVEPTLNLIPDTIRARVVTYIEERLETL